MRPLSKVFCSPELVPQRPGVVQLGPDQFVEAHPEAQSQVYQQLHGQDQEDGGHDGPAENPLSASRTVVDLGHEQLTDPSSALAQVMGNGLVSVLISSWKKKKHLELEISLPVDTFFLD